MIAQHGMDRMTRYVARDGGFLILDGRFVFSDDLESCICCDVEDSSSESFSDSSNDSSSDSSDSFELDSVFSSLSESNPQSSIDSLDESSSDDDQSVIINDSITFSEGSNSSDSSDSSSSSSSESESSSDSSSSSSSSSDDLFESSSSDDPFACEPGEFVLRTVWTWREDVQTNVQRFLMAENVIGVDDLATFRISSHPGEINEIGFSANLSGLPMTFVDAPPSFTPNVEVSVNAVSGHLIESLRIAYAGIGGCNEVDNFSPGVLFASSSLACNVPTSGFVLFTIEQDIPTGPTSTAFLRLDWEYVPCL